MSGQIERKSARKIVFLEANEIPQRVLDHFVETEPESALAKALPVSRRYETVAADTCSLSPWITWPTLHRGVNNEAHGILHFGQDLTRADEAYPPIWRLLMEGGVRTSVFGPLHSSPLPANADGYAMFVPDTFAHSAESHPKSLTRFQEFNLSMARQSPRNVSRSIDVASLGGFLASAPFLGLRPQTVLSVLRQLMDERSAGWKSTRRRTFQSILAFDLFMAQVKRQKPGFSTFFTNHVASAMHRYWAALFPKDFETLELGEEWQHRFAGEIPFAMQWVDRFAGRLFEFADRNPEFIVVIASSMGQEAASGKRIDTQLYLRNPTRLLERAGIGESDWERRPAMDPTVSLYVDSSRVTGFREYLESVTIQGQPIDFAIKEGGFFDLVFGHTNIDPEVDELRIGEERAAFADLGFELTKVEDEAGSTGYHIPEGILSIYDPLDRSEKSAMGSISTINVAPALLDHFDLDIPDYMTRSATFSI